MSEAKVRPESSMDSNRNLSSLPHSASTSSTITTVSNISDDGTIGYPLTANSSQADFLDLNRSASKSRLCRVLVFGLLLYVVNIGLHLAIASQYLGMRDCHRGIVHTFHDFRLSDIVKLNETTSGNETGNQIDDGSNEPVNPLESMINEQLFVRVRSQLISLVPEHWVERILDIVQFQLKKYNPTHIARLCTFNGQSFRSSLALGAYICEKALSPEHRNGIEEIFAEISEEDEAAILAAMIDNDFPRLSLLVPKSIGVELPPDALQVANKITKDLTPEELGIIIVFLDDPEVASRIGPMMKALSKVDPVELDRMSKTLGKINSDNIPIIEQKLGTLNLTLADFVTNPAVLVKFIQQPSLASVLIEVQGLLPLFLPSDINAILVVKNSFDDIPGAGKVLGKVLNLPFKLLRKIMSIKFDEREMSIMQALGETFKDERAKKLFKIVQALNLVNDKERFQAMSNLTQQCVHSSLKVKCEDNSKDLCPNGHIYYAVLTLISVAIPGILFGITEFCHFRAFRFGSLFGGLFGIGMAPVLKWLLLPFYVVVMIPMTFVITVAQYYRALKKIFQQRSPSKIQDCYDDALNLHSLEASSNSFFQVIIQLYFLLLLVVFGTGTIISGVDAVDVFKAVVPLTVASLIVSSFNYIFISWKIQKLDHRTKDLVPDLDERPPILGVLTFLAWILSTKLAQIFSLILMALVMWIEIISGDLSAAPSGFSIKFVPVFVLMVAFPLNFLYHRKFVHDDEMYHHAHGIISAIFPSRYLNRTDRLRSRNFLAFNQFTHWVVHILAWLVYSVLVFSLNDEEAGLLRIIPLIAAFMSFGPFFGIIHWVTFVKPSYGYSDSTLPKELGSLQDIEGIPKKALFKGWQIITGLTRIASLALMGFVFYEHFIEIGSGVKWTFIYAFPYIILLAVANIGLQFSVLGGSLKRGFGAILVPNGYHYGTLNQAGRYIILNAGLNLVLHLILWLNMTFYCWECTKILDIYFQKLGVCFPLSIGLWVVSLILTLVVWRLCIRKSLGEVRPSTPVTNKAFTPEENSTAWPAKIDSLTTKF